MRNLIKLIVLTTVGISMTACSVSGGGIRSSEHGFVNLTADKEGMRAFGDSLNGFITNGKAEANAMTTPAYELRKKQEKTIENGLAWKLRKYLQGTQETNGRK